MSILVSMSLFFFFFLFFASGQLIGHHIDLIDLLKIVPVIGALRINAFVYAKTGSVLDRDQSVTAVRALVFNRL